MSPSLTLSQIKQILIKFAEIGLSNGENYPSTSGKQSRLFEITVNKASALSIALKNRPYDEVYRALADSGSYNIMMLDGAMLVFQYVFDLGKINKHTLSYFPSPNLESFQNEPEIYEQDEIYADILSRRIVPFPIRFDFDSSTYEEVSHPYSHLTLGQYKNCRIPVCSPVPPFVFGGFILRNFYNTVFEKYSDKIPKSKTFFDKTISRKEESIPHLVCRPRSSQH